MDFVDRSQDRNISRGYPYVSIYKSRWNIEQVFRLTKHKGFQLESSQLETGHAIENLTALVFIAAIKVFQMVKSRHDEQRPVSDIFDEQEVTLLRKINSGVEGNSDKIKEQKQTWINRIHYLDYRKVG